MIKSFVNFVGISHFVKNQFFETINDDQKIKEHFVKYTYRIFIYDILG